MRLKILAGLAITLLFIGLFFGLAGRWTWPRGWAFIRYGLVIYPQSCL